MNTNPIFYIPGRRSYTAALTRFLAELLPAVDHTRPLIILCIGTTQVQGDRLGPLVGTLLEEKLKKTDRLLPVHIFGTEEQAVHALNLPVILRAISRDFPGAPILAVDAAISVGHRPGCITVGLGPLLPGAGLSKQLPAAGDLHITGTVSRSGALGYFFLKHTPRRKVCLLADIISDGIWNALLCAPARTCAALPAPLPPWDTERSG